MAVITSYPGVYVNEETSLSFSISSSDTVIPAFVTNATQTGIPQEKCIEPNSQPTWQKVKAAVDNYLHSLWQQGALAGNKPEDAWFVNIGKDVTMTECDINLGRLTVKIGLAAVRPA